jgi:hypothetical protein
MKRPCSIEEHLRGLSLYSSAALTLHGIWVSDKLKLGKMLGLISAPPFQTFSDHGVGHSEMLLSAMSRLLGDRLCLLGATDTWMLLECAYRHDLGMYVEYKDILNVLNNSKFIYKIEELLDDEHEEMRNAARHVRKQLPELCDWYTDVSNDTVIPGDLSHHFRMVLASYFRAGHAERSRKMLIEEMENAVDQPVPMRLWRLIAEICAGHGKKTVEDTLILPHWEIGMDNDEAHPRLVQVLLRLADTLDLDNNRFNGWQLAQWGIEILPLDTRAHIQKHKSLEHLHVSPLTVSVKARMNYTPVRGNNHDVVMSDREYRRIILEKEDEYAALSASAEEVAYSLRKSGNNLVRKMQEKEDTRQENYQISRIKRKASRLVRQYMDEIRKELAFFALNWKDIVPDGFHGSAPKFDEIKSEIWWRSKKLDEEIVDLSYSISHKRASDLMRGASLYGDADYATTPIERKHYHHLIFLREFVQNGMDAMRLRLFRDLQDRLYNAERKYKKLNSVKSQEWNIFDVLDVIIPLEGNTLSIEVQYRLSDHALVFKIRDSGCGIDKDTMKRMKEVGAKKPHAVLDEYRRMPEWLRPNGSFGIGMQSVYAVTNHFTGVSQSHRDLKKHELIFEYNNNGGSLFAEELLKDNDADAERWQTHGMGTLFRVEITRERVVRDKIFAGVTALDYEVNAVFDEVEAQIRTFLGEDIYPIHVKFYVDDVEIQRGGALAYPCAFSRINKMYKKRNDEKLQSYCHENAQGFTCFVGENPKNDFKPGILRNVLLTYNMQHNMLVEIVFTKEAEIHTRYYYRGLYVPDVEYVDIMQYPGCKLTVGHWGNEAEKTLLVSRNKLTKEATPLVHKAIFESVDVALGLFTTFVEKEYDKPAANRVPLFGSEKEMTAFAKAVWHYQLRRVNFVPYPANNRAKCERLLHKLAEENLDGTHDMLHYKDNTMETLEVSDSDRYRLLDNKVWYVDSDIPKYLLRERHMKCNIPGNDAADRSPNNDNDNKEVGVITSGEYIALDTHVRPLFVSHTQVQIYQLQWCELTEVNQAWWLYRISNQPVDYIIANKETQENITKAALDTAMSKNAFYPLDNVFGGRPVLPGFNTTRMLNVTTLPKSEEENGKHPIVYNYLGNYFIWPFSNVQLRRIWEWYENPKTDKKKLERKSRSGTLELEDLKQCEIIAEALRESNPAYKTLISFVADNRSHKTTYPANIERSRLEKEIRDQYENIIIKELWPQIQQLMARIIK